MAGTSLLALIDDIATVLDDVALMTKVAAKKTAGVLGDDLALNAEQVSGVRAERELPVVWAVAKGSFKNKMILVPAAILITAVAPWAITPLLMLGGAYLCDADLTGAQVGKGGDEATLVGSRPVVQIGPIGSRNDWLLVFWCGDAGVRISAGCQKQISEAHFLKRLAYRHGEGDQANIHAQHYIEALAFAKRLLKDQAEGKL